MLRRHSVKSKPDLHRRKSMSSARSVPLEHIGVAAAERDSKLAAIQAFSRAQSRQSADMDLFPPQHASSPQKENRSPARHSQTGGSMCPANDYSSRQAAGQRQSVRFIGPEAGLQGRASKSSMRACKTQRDDAVPLRPIHRSKSSQNVGSIAHGALRDTQNIQPPDRVSSQGKTLSTPNPALTKEYLQVITADEPQHTPEDDVASMPSSYKRVRKARSMYTTRDSVEGGHSATRQAPMFNTSSREAAHHAVPAPSWSRFSFLNWKDNEKLIDSPTLRTPKSMSFLRSRRECVGTSMVSQGLVQGTSPDLSGSQLCENSLRSRLKPKTAIFFGPKGNRIGQNAPKTMRKSSSSNVLPTYDTTASMPLSFHGSIKIKARKVSSSLKSKFKSIFISKSEDDVGLPAQQIESQKTHTSTLLDMDHFSPAVSESGVFPERSSLSRVSSRVPSLHAVPSSERLRSRRGSIDSFRSEQRKLSDEKSRVTSWASTEANTVITHRPREGSEEWERQRLSSITEHDFYAHSPCSSRPKAGLQTIASKEKLKASNTEDRLPVGATVDSQRVYSALMKRMNETQQLAGIIEQQRQFSDDSDPFRTLSPPTSDKSSDSESPVVPKLAQQFSSGRGDIETRSEQNRDCSHSSSAMTRSSHKEAPNLKPGDDGTLSPPVHLAPKGAELHLPRPIADRSSAFFGSPTSHLFRTRSPWRQSLQETIEKERVECEEANVKTADSSVDGAAAGMAGERAYSDSTYSQDTQVHKFENRQELSGEYFEGCTSTQRDGSNIGDAPTYRPTGDRHISTASSIDWKARLSHDVARVSESPTSPTRVSGRPSEVEYVVPTMPKALGHGHVRETAQIESYEEDERNSSLAVRMPTIPTRPLGEIEPNVVKLTPQQRSVMQTTPPRAAAALLQENAPLMSGNVGAAEYFQEDRVPCALAQDAMRPRASPFHGSASCRGQKPGGNNNRTQTPTRDDDGMERKTKSLANPQSLGRIRTEETGSPRRLGSPTVRLIRKTANKLEPNAESVVTSPGFSTAFERHFGSLGRGLGAKAAAKENQSPHGDGNVGEGSGAKATTKTQIKGSKTMGELFGGSRKQQRVSGDGRAFV